MTLPTIPLNESDQVRINNVIRRLVEDANTNTVGIPGVTDGSNAAAGDVGEYIESRIELGSAISLSSSIAANVTFITLTAGDWDVWVNCFIAAAATTVITFAAASSSLVSATLDAQTDRVGILALPNAGFTGLPAGQCVSKARFSLSGTTIIYMVALATFTTSTATAFGAITARRMR